MSHTRFFIPLLLYHAGSKPFSCSTDELLVLCRNMGPECWYGVCHRCGLGLEVHFSWIWTGIGQIIQIQTSSFWPFSSVHGVVCCFLHEVLFSARSRLHPRSLENPTHPAPLTRTLRRFEVTTDRRITRDVLFSHVASFSPRLLTIDFISIWILQCTHKLYQYYCTNKIS